MPQPADSERTIRRWRRVFLGIYVAVLVCAVLVVFFSVAAVNCGNLDVPVTGKRISPSGDVPRELADCESRLEALLTDLHREAFGLLAKTQRFETNPAAEWSNWSDDWHHRWRAVGWRCRLRERARSGASPEIEKMAAIHSALVDVHASYAGVVGTFAARNVDMLHKLRQEIAAVRAMIGRRRLHAPRDTALPPRSGATQ